MLQLYIIIRIYYMCNNDTKFVKNYPELMISFREVTQADEPFIGKLYRTTRENELALTNWPEEQKHSFVIMQLMAQTTHYKKVYPDASYQIILVKNKPAGRLYVWEDENEVSVIDIALLPEHRGKGIGSKILSDLIKNALQKNKMVKLQVVHGNPAKKLYERLGFIKVSSTASHDYMELKP